MDKEEKDRRLSDLFRKIAEEKAENDKLEGFVKKLESTLYPSVEEALKAQGKQSAIL